MMLFIFVFIILSFVGTWGLLCVLHILDEVQFQPPYESLLMIFETLVEVLIYHCWTSCMC